MEEIKNRTAVIIFAAMIFGILLGERFCGYKNFALFLLFFILTAKIFDFFIKNFKKIKRKRHKRLFNNLLLLSFSVIFGYLLIQPFVLPTLSDNHIYYKTQFQQKQTVIGKVSSEPSYKPGKRKFEVSVISGKNKAYKKFL